MIGALFGGIGLFLVGMKLLTEGMQAAAGASLQTALRKYTATPWMAVGFGAVATVLVQSSSAVTLATIGFASSGLLRFQQALGVVFGANLGTTATVWLLALVGLKLKIDSFALPLIGLGAVVELVVRGPRAHYGRALAGFGMLFLGINAIQEGMAGVTAAMDPAAYAAPGLAGNLLLVLFGGASTVILQSSSAAIATTLAALSVGTLSFEQAAAVVIGQNIGTTLTAVVGALGGSAVAKRTAAGHVLFNVVTGLIALIALDPFVWVVLRLSDAVEGGDHILALATFHTAFNALGILLFTPRLAAVAAFIEARIPDGVTTLTHRLKAAAGTGVTEVVLEASRRTAADIALTVLAPSALADDVDPAPERAQQALDELSTFLAPLRTDPTSAAQFAHHLALLHAVDHLRLLVALAKSPPHRVFSTEVGPRLSTLCALVPAVLAQPPTAPPEALAELAAALHDQRVHTRAELLKRTAAGEITPAEANSRLSALAWAEEVAHHAERVVTRLQEFG